MAMIHLGAKTGFTIIPEGIHIFKITEVQYNPLYGKMQISMETKDGLKHIERFTMMDDRGRPNQGALNAFSYFARVAMNNFDLEDIDCDTLVGHYMKCEVTHEDVPGKNGKVNTYARLGDKAPATGFEGEEEAPPFDTETPAEEKTQYDLDSVLN